MGGARRVRGADFSVIMLGAEIGRVGIWLGFFLGSIYHLSVFVGDRATGSCGL